MLSELEMVLRLVIAAVLGSVVGFERERLLWAAGLRTHMLVSVGSCLFMIVSAYGFSAELGPHVILDPSRVAAQVVTGVGFLGAGSIILRNEVVKGLTTAASLWAVAAVGLAVGGGLYLAAAATTGIVLVILAGVKPLEERFRNGRGALELTVQAQRGALTVGALERALGWRASRLKRLVIRPTELADTDELSISFSALSARDAEEMIRQLSALPDVGEVRKAA